MITAKDFCDIIGNKIASDMWKSLIRNNFPPHIAERTCAAIDSKEKAEHFQRLLMEYNDWMLQQQRQHVAIRQFLVQYYK